MIYYLTFEMYNVKEEENNICYQKALSKDHEHILTKQ